ncbi:uncharacterized protein LOC142591647 isoform X2 [Dermacentor variabilis]|uniref:uncharacterized protein LOC142591647 isoform X2 n=1 Tax=Dermacentor variabilis TaxID=34621 RepID=UPI003F5B5966
MLLQRPQQTNSLMPSILCHEVIKRRVPNADEIECIETWNGRKLSYLICNGKPFRVFQRQCLRLVTAAPSYRLRKPRGRGGKCRQPAHLEQPP